MLIFLYSIIVWDNEFGFETACYGKCDRFLFTEHFSLKCVGDQRETS